MKNELNSLWKRPMSNNPNSTEPTFEHSTNLKANLFYNTVDGNRSTRKKAESEKKKADLQDIKNKIEI